MKCQFKRTDTLKRDTGPCSPEAYNVRTISSPVLRLIPFQHMLGSVQVSAQRPLPLTGKQRKYAQKMPPHELHTFRLPRTGRRKAHIPHHLRRKQNSSSMSGNHFGLSKYLGSALYVRISLLCLRQRTRQSRQMKFRLGAELHLRNVLKEARKKK